MKKFFKLKLSAKHHWYKVEKIYFWKTPNISDVTYYLYQYVLEIQNWVYEPLSSTYSYSKIMKYLMEK